MTDKPTPSKELAQQALLLAQQALLVHDLTHKLADLRLREMRYFWNDKSFPDDLCNKVAREEADKLRKLALEVNDD